MPFEWVVGDSSKDHTVTASMFYDVLATVRYTTLWGITRIHCNHRERIMDIYL